MDFNGFMKEIYPDLIAIARAVLQFGLAAVGIIAAALLLRLKKIADEYIVKVQMEKAKDAADVAVRAVEQHPQIVLPTDKKEKAVEFVMAQLPKGKEELAGALVEASVHSFKKEQQNPPLDVKVDLEKQ